VAMLSSVAPVGKDAGGRRPGSSPATPPVKDAGGRPGSSPSVTAPKGLAESEQAQHLEEMGRGSGAFRRGARVPIKAISLGLRLSGRTKLHRKLWRNPARFFGDSSNGAIRAFGRLAVR
jgi:hypothetical protein